MGQRSDGDRRPETELTGRALHRRMRAEIDAAMKERQWAWRAKEAGIAPSTLSTQLAKPKFNVETLTRVARVLGLDLNEILCVRPRSS
jgi:lambda repressor-like predicted transcriptional regulator